MHPHQQQQQGQRGIEGPSRKEAFNALLLAARIHRDCIAPWLDSGFGPEAFGWPTFFAFIILAVAAGGTGDPGMCVFAAGWLVLMIYHRVAGVVARSRGYVVHSQYGGYPWLAMRILKVLPFNWTEQQARAFELLICLVVGGLLLSLSQLLGAFVMAGAFSMGFLLGLQRELLRRKGQQLIDAQWEQQNAVAERNRMLRKR